MADYYSALLRAVTAPSAGDQEWRRGLYERARNMLTQRLRARRPPLSVAGIASEQAALDAAIKHVEAEMEWTGARTVSLPGSWTDRAAIAPARRNLVRARTVAAALCASGFSYSAKTKRATRPRRSRCKPRPRIRPRMAISRRERTAVRPKPICPMCSGVSRPFIGRWSRSAPSSSIGCSIFFILIQPNNVALRYGIAVGVAMHEPRRTAPHRQHGGMASHGSHRRACSTAILSPCRADRAIRSARGCFSSTPARRGSTAPTRRRQSAIP